MARLAFPAQEITLARQTVDLEQLWNHVVALGGFPGMKLERRTLQPEAHEDAVWTAVWNPDGRTLITGSVDEIVKVWAVAESSAESIHTYTGHTLGVISVAVDPSGVYAASSALDSFIRVWNLEDNSTKAVMETPPSETWQIAFNPVSDTLTVAAAGGSSNRICVWSCDSAEKVQDLVVPAKADKAKKDMFSLSVAYSPNGLRIACGGMDGSVSVFDTQTGQLLHSLEGHYKPVRSLAFTPDSAMLLTACDDMQSHLYDVQNGALIAAFFGHDSWVLSVACHPSGSCLATGSSDSKVKLWDLQTRSCAGTYSEHTDQVWDVAFNKDGSILSSVSDDKAVCFHNFS